MRLCFALGNVVAKHESSRDYVMSIPSALDTLLAVIKHYLQLDIKVIK